MADPQSKIRITAENATQKAFNEIRRSMQDIEGSANTLRNTMLGLGTGLSIGGFVAFVKSGIDAADGLNKLSQKVGVSVESLSAFQYAAKLSDVSAEQLSAGLGRLAKSAAESQGGVGEAAEAFQALGISVTDSSGKLKSTEDLLLDVSERFSGIKDSAGKTAIAMRLFGRAGAELIPFLNQGRRGFAELRAEAEQLGIIISSKTAAAAERFNDEVTKLAQGSNKLKIALAEQTLPALNNIVTAMRLAAQEGGLLKAVLVGIGGVLVETFSASDQEKLAKVRQELEGLRQEWVNIRNAAPGFRSGTDKRLDRVQRDITAALKQEEQLLAAIEARNKPKKGATDDGKKDAPPLAGPKDNRFDSAIKALEDEAVKVQDLTRTQEILAAVEAGRYGKLTESQRNRLLGLAAEVDIQKQLTADEKTRKQAAEDENRKKVEELQRLQALRRQFLDMIDPIRKFREQLVQVDDLLARGEISQEQATEIKFKIKLDIDEANDKLNGIKDKVKEVADDSKEIGLIFSSAASDAIREWRGFGDLIRSIGKDIAQYILKKQVVDPLGKAASGLFDDVFKGLFRADGGPVSGGSPYIVGERGPELFVPSSSGSIVPNHALGGGGVTIVQNIAFSGGTPAAVRDAVNAMLPQISNAAVAAVRADRNRTGDAR